MRIGVPKGTRRGADFARPSKVEIQAFPEGKHRLLSFQRGGQYTLDGGLGELRSSLGRRWGSAGRSLEHFLRSGGTFDSQNSPLGVYKTIFRWSEFQIPTDFIQKTLKWLLKFRAPLLMSRCYKGVLILADFCFGVGVSGRRPSKSADPGGQGGVWGLEEVRILRKCSL